LAHILIHRSNALRWNASCNAPALRNKIHEDAGASTGALQHGAL